jgi:hypothetical protein
MGWGYENIKHRGGGKRTTVAIARAFSVRIRRMLLDQAYLMKLAFQRLLNKAL